jgi:class 3 adenylate cyclase
VLAGVLIVAGTPLRVLAGAASIAAVAAFAANPRLAERNGIASVAFPALSTGAFGYPAEPAAQVAFRTILDEVPSLSVVRHARFVLFDEAGPLTLQHVTPGRTYSLATISVAEPALEASRRRDFDTLRVNDEMVAERELEKIKTIGDCYMAAGGLPQPLDDHAARVVELGLAMVQVVSGVKVDGAALTLRVGVHSGPAVGGVIGLHKFAFDLWGDTVNVASRLEAHGIPNRVHVSEATWRLVSDRFECESQGMVDLRGHGPMQTFAIVGPAVGMSVAGSLVRREVEEC